MDPIQEEQLQEKREQRVKDALFMRTLDKKRKISKHVVENPMLEINMRILEYESMFRSFSLNYLALQCIQDFNQFFLPLQAKRFDINKPIALIRDSKEKVYINKSITRPMFEEGGVIYFLLEELAGVK